ncbi:adenylate/guanylate cyclase domain-containing protein [Aestuariivita sp.]|jgi:adenylate cyclase|uniref:adenylate/guanylate cyclase domain-containing protein n=1 Tax=Aestuariivita sp. TaxID=1872407 RepID=UPI0021742D22|nr:adenylate/guanylate cyclase domain-containing protein [Aestuariivita sp.]MCE8007364.1 adenylate/guanylate cyclase domain-containing protein [Aestuariivita sp.]
MLRPPLTITDTKTVFQQAEIRAEYLVAWLRLGLSGTLLAAIVLALAATEIPVGADLRADDVLVRQLIFAVGTMAAYFLLGLACLLAIRKGRFRPWMVWPSAAGDCLFILVSIWLSLVNTGFQGDYIVVLPTLWLVPVVLACGVLRFNPALQAFIIVALVLGLLVVDRLAKGMPELTDFRVLGFFFDGPPNIMRLVMIALAGGVLVVATYRMRALFLRTLTEAEGRVNLTRYLPAEVAPELARAGLDALQTGSRQQMAVMFVDMRGFTGRAEAMRPEELSAFVTQYRRRITDTARAHGGIIDKFMGDAVMIVFAAGDVPQQAAARAIRCGQAILAAIADWDQQGAPPVQVGIGLHWGVVFAGVVGDHERLEYSVFGDTVNIAARLEALTKQGALPLIASADLLDQAAADRSGWHLLPPTELRGRSAPLQVLGWRTAVRT